MSEARTKRTQGARPPPTSPSLSFHMPFLGLPLSHLFFAFASRIQAAPARELRRICDLTQMGQTVPGRASLGGNVFPSFRPSSFRSCPLRPVTSGPLSRLYGALIHMHAAPHRSCASLYCRFLPLFSCCGPFPTTHARFPTLRPLDAVPAWRSTAADFFFPFFW